MAAKVGALDNEIWKRIYNNSNHEKKIYASRDIVDGIVDDKTVAHVLCKNLADDSVNYIVNHAKRIFCVMVLAGRSNNWANMAVTAAKLQKYGVTDDFLPILYDSQIDGERVSSMKGAPKDDMGMSWFSREIQGVEADQYTRWVQEFSEKQWWFLAPVFNDHEVVYPLQDHCPLPFTHYKSHENAEGQASILGEAKIHREHLKLEIASESVAIKKIINNTGDKQLQKAVQREVAALDLVRRLYHPHLIKFIASYSQQGQHYLIFEWADGGNLKEFWKNGSHIEGFWNNSGNDVRNQRAPSRQETTEWAIEQMVGLAGALNMLHNPNSDGLNCRHGDLKPANIVRATGNKDDQYYLGTLQITDMGLAKVNDQRTRIRRTSGTHSITERYQSPEFKFRNSPDTPTSRSYDMWSMGCIMLEFVIWLLYGGAQLDEFNNSVRNYFFDEASQEFQLHPSVIRWISHMNQTAFSTPNHPVIKALAKILKLVEDHLLVEDGSWREEVKEDPSINLKITGPDDNTAATLESDTNTIARMKSDELLLKMKDIQSQMKSLHLVSDSLPSFSPPSSDASPPPTTESYLTVPGSNLSRSSLSPSPSRPPNPSSYQANTQNEYSVEPMPDFWDSYPDNELALRVFPNINFKPLELPNPASPLCNRCSYNDRGSKGIFSSHFIFSREQNLDERCGICQTLFANSNVEKFVRRGSYLAAHSAGPPVHSIIIGPGISAAPNDLQRSLPRLPEFFKQDRTVNEDGFVILKQWLKDCDDNKHECKSAPKPNPDSNSIPTRLISVEKMNSSTVRLVETGEWLKRKGPYPEDLRYVALSHRWGYSPERFELNSTTHNDWVKEIRLCEMPRNFRDAVTVTRALGIPYLWIDSVCILQDNKADWKQEARRMKDVYNGAYCTVAATSAETIHDGFLRNRPSVSCTKIRTMTPSGKEADIYLREAIDDFRGHVEEAELNKRGWVFQERALSRRILHFAKFQVYLECGGGIWCESTTRLFNRASLFFSDANFPSQALKFYTGMKIRYYETIYTEYSRRQFSQEHEYDRAIAMEGLESKILAAYRTAGRFGILELPVRSTSRFHRSLMWQRDGKGLMRRITGGDDPEIQKLIDAVPTWSWMKSMGSIKYFPIDMDSAIWSPDEELTSPFKGRLGLVDNPQGLYISASAYEVKEDAYSISTTTSGHTENLFVLDCVSCPEDVKGLKCVVVGERKNSPTARLHYVLLVAPRSSDQYCTEYERVGVGRIEGRYLLNTENHRHKIKIA